MLFGHQNDAADQQTTATPAEPIAPINPPSAPMPSAGVNPLAVDPATGASLPVAPPPPPSLDEYEIPEPSILNQPTETAFVEQTQPGPAFIPDIVPSEQTTPQMPQLETEELETDSTASQFSEAPEVPQMANDLSDDELLSLKQLALTELQPLVGQLDQTPEEKFRTTMMLIQSTDNPGLLKDAHAAALQIEDEKVRAQALLDVVNEINYFTQPKTN